MLIKSNKLYDALKYFAQVFLPAVGALYFGLAEIWGFPNAAEVVGTITVVDAFLGVVLMLSSSAYKNSDERFDATATVTPSLPGDEEQGGMVTLNVDPHDFLEKDELLVKVDRPQEPG